MVVQLSEDIRNAHLDQIETTIGASGLFRVAVGAAPANVAAADTGLELIVITMPVDAWANAAAGAKAIQGSWTGTATGGASATPGHVRFKTAAAVVKMQMTAGVGAGEMSFNGTITSGQTVTVASGSLTGGGA